MLVVVEIAIKGGRYLWDFLYLYEFSVFIYISCMIKKKHVNNFKKKTEKKCTIFLNIYLHRHFLDLFIIYI